VRVQRLPLVELVLVVWTVAAIALGYLVAREVRGLRSLGTTVVVAGRSIEQTADALDSLSGLPFVGRRLHRLALDAHGTARSAVANGRGARSDVDALANLLWVAVAASLAAPALALYGFLRLSERLP
jgi:hypothetical protein